MKLDQDFLAVVRGPIRRVWNGINADIGDCSNKEAIELCLDADRIVQMTNSQVAEDAIVSAIKEHGLNKVYNFLSKNIPLA